MNLKLDQIKNWPERAREARWSASALAKQCGVTVRTLHRHFVKQMGKNPKAWLAEQRNHNAIELLCDGSSVKETASCLSYTHPSNFARQFKWQTGYSPSETPNVRK
jgi:AraC family transcriptional activator FtrA